MQFLVRTKSDNTWIVAYTIRSDFIIKSSFKFPVEIKISF